MNIHGILNIPQVNIKQNDEKQSIAVRKITPRSLYGFPSGVTIDSFKSYLPQIKQLSKDEIFDVQFASGTRLSDGSVLIRPVILSLGEVEITPLKEKKGSYVISRYPINESIEDLPEKKVMTEGELLANKTLCRGMIKQLNDDAFLMIYKDSDGNVHKEGADKAKCLQVLRENMLYM